MAYADLSTMKRLGGWNPFPHPYHACFSSDDSRLAVKNTAGQIAVLNLREGTAVRSHWPHDEGASLYFSVRDEYLVDGSWSGNIHVRDSATLASASQFQFPGEQISEVSSSADRMTWVFAHVPKTRPGENYGDSPYLSLWQWPLERPRAILPSQMDILYAASVSPCGSFIALVGHRRRTKADVLSIMSSDGQLLRETSTSMGGTGSRTRWSSDGRFVGTVQAEGFAIFRASDLARRARVDVKFPSDLAFLESGQLAIGTWEYATVVQVQIADA